MHACVFVLVLGGRLGTRCMSQNAVNRSCYFAPFLGVKFVVFSGARALRLNRKLLAIPLVAEPAGNTRRTDSQWAPPCLRFVCRMVEEMKQRQEQRLNPGKRAPGQGGRQASVAPSPKKNFLRGFPIRACEDNMFWITREPRTTEFGCSKHRKIYLGENCCVKRARNPIDTSRPIEERTRSLCWRACSGGALFRV